MNQIYVNEESGRIVKLGDPLAPDDALDTVPKVEGAVAVFPIREKDGQHMNWGLVASSLAKSLKKGYVRVTPGNPAQPYTIAYLTGPNQKRVADGEYLVEGQRRDGSKIVVMPEGKEERPTTTWRESSHEAGVYGTSLLGNLIPGRLFPYAKSLYAVEDCLRVAVGTKPDALVLDFLGSDEDWCRILSRAGLLGELFEDVGELFVLGVGEVVEEFGVVGDECLVDGVSRGLVQDPDLGGDGFHFGLVSFVSLSPELVLVEERQRQWAA